MCHHTTLRYATSLASSIARDKRLASKTAMYLQMQGPGEIVMQRGSCFDDGGAQALQTGTGTVGHVQSWCLEARTCNSDMMTAKFADAAGLQMSAAKALSLRPMGRSQSAVDLHLLSSMSRAGSSKDLRQLEHVSIFE